MAMPRLPAACTVTSQRVADVRAEGNLFFTDRPNDRIMKWSADGKLSTFRQPAGRAAAAGADDRKPHSVFSGPRKHVVPENDQGAAIGDPIHHVMPFGSTTPALRCP
jgi:sugar lactone lactonase YvrE